MTPLRELEINRVKMMAEGLGWQLTEMKHDDKFSQVVLRKDFPEELLKREQEMKPTTGIAS